MKLLDRFYENYIRPICDGLNEVVYDVKTVTENLLIYILNVFLIVVLFLTIPLWMFPYNAKKKKEGGRNSDEIQKQESDN